MNPGNPTHPDAPRGFGGLSALVSVVPEIAPQAPKAAPEPPKAPAQRTSAGPPVNDRSTPSRPSAKLMFFGLVGAIIVGMVVIAQNAPNSAPTYVPPRPSAPSSYAPTPSPNVPVPPYAPPNVPASRPPSPPVQDALRESKPSAASGQVRGASEVYYCLSEGVRLDAMRTAVNERIQSHVTKFNALIEDFNTRCSSYRYRTADMDRAKTIVEARRSQLVAEAMSAVRSWR